MDELLDYQSRRTDETAAIVARWGNGPAVIPWVTIGLELAGEFGFSGPRTARAQALLRTALYDTVLATLDAQGAYAREAPSIPDPTLTPMEGVKTDSPSFPSLHAAVAGAASTVLTYLFPDAEAGRFETLAEEAATSRLWAGANYPSDVEAGLALGQAVGELAVARGEADGADATWDGSGRLTGEGTWVPTPPRFVETPVEPLGGTWETWVLPSGDAVRPAAPPEYGSPLWQAELEAVQEATANRTLEQVRIVEYWDAKGPFASFTEYALDLIERNGLDDAHAARALALMSVAQADAVIAVWDAKYTWWTERPITADPDLDMLLPTPPYPSYPSGFSAVAGSAAVVLSHLFPRAEVDLMASAAEAAAQRCWSGIHFPLDDDIGLEMGYQVGRLVNTVARDDGAE
jgi:membrane-associated phospholipid phosphatase